MNQYPIWNITEDKINLAGFEGMAWLSFTISSGSEKVWNAMANIDNWANWQIDISSSKMNGELKPDWRTGGQKFIQQFTLLCHL